MKKTALSVCVLLLLFASLAGVCRAETVLFDFENDVNPGFCRSGSCEYRITDTDDGSRALEITGRSGNGDGVAIRPAALGISVGDTVALSFRVRHDSGLSGSVAVSYIGGSNAKLIAADAPSGVWTQISGTFVLDEIRSLLFNVETHPAGGDYLIDDVTVGVTRPAQAENDRSYDKWPTDIPSLKEVYKDHFLFGGEAAGREFSDPARMAFYASQYAVMTPGNELKPSAVLDLTESRKAVRETGDETAVRVRLKAAEPFLNFCRDHDIPVHGHTLLWHNQTPAEFFHLGYQIGEETAGRDVMLGRMENYIKAVMEITEERYPGLIMSWDVVNEAVSDSAPALRSDVSWYKTVGPDYVEKAFAFARKYARSGVLLCYNDYSTPYHPKLEGIMALLKALTAQGNIDCFGFQAHYEAGQPSVYMVEEAVQKISGLGLKLRVSEMDIKIRNNSAEERKKQAVKYKELMDLFVRYDGLFIAVQTWGGTDDVSWLSGNYPLLFGPYGKPKPAFWSVVGEEETK